jgi:hypothetical protein
MWLWNALRRRILPLPLTLNRLAAPRWVFILGITPPQIDVPSLSARLPTDMKGGWLRVDDGGLKDPPTFLFVVRDMFSPERFCPDQTGCMKVGLSLAFKPICSNVPKAHLNRKTAPTPHRGGKRITFRSFSSPGYFF